MRNRSTSKPGNRAARRPRGKGHNRQISQAAAANRTAPTNLVQALEVGGDATKLDLFFDKPVVPGIPASPGATDITMTGTSATTRHAISAVALDAVSIRATLSGALTQSKTYNCVIDAQQGIAVPANGKWGNLSDAFST